MFRTNALDAARRAFGGVVRGLLEKADDSQTMQGVNVRFLHDEQNPTVERFQPFGFSSVPLPPSGGKAAEVLALFLGGNRSHPVVIGIDDRRHRPKNFKPGESAHYDDQKQISKIARDGHYHTAKQHVMSAGDKPATTFDLNEQLKGLAARVAQTETNVHGLFDVTSKFRQIVQGTIPGVAAVAPILNQDPSGLTAMADAIEHSAGAYLQQQVQQALAKFLAPNLSGLSSLLGGGLEKAIGDLEAQVGSLITQNPVVGTVDDLTAELADLKASGAAPSVIASGTSALQGQIDALTAANPVVATIANMRGTLANLTSQAGPALNFLAPQQRLVQGISKSMHLSNPG